MNKRIIREQSIKKFMGKTYEQGRQEREDEIIELIIKHHKENLCYCNIGSDVLCEVCRDCNEIIEQIKKQPKQNKEKKDE